MISVRGRGQLCRDAQPVVSFSHAALKNVAHLQLLSNNAQIDMFTLEAEGRASRDDTKFRDLGQRIDDLLRDSVCKVFVLRIRTHVDERQYHEGVAYRTFGRDRRGDWDTDGCDQPVASFRDCLDDAWIAGVVIEGAA